MELETDRLLEKSGAPTDRRVERLDVRSLGPPKPLAETLERLAEMEGGTLVQINDRVPQHLYPKLDERGYDYVTQEEQGATVTIIWQ